MQCYSKKRVFFLLLEVLKDE
uniref:Uncharacterized protein n=1 Tax=Arundo donax TaxID=35708 RepID=A0A0A9CGU4_ARUDO